MKLHLVDSATLLRSMKRVLAFVFPMLVALQSDLNLCQNYMRFRAYC